MLQEALEAIRVKAEPGMIRFPRGADVLDDRPGTIATLAALHRLVDDLGERFLAQDLGGPHLVTRRGETASVILEADRWGLLVLAQEALRLAAGRDDRGATFDAASYLGEIEDIIVLRRVDTPPRRFVDDE
jgi:hypothetical protein